MRKIIFVLICFFIFINSSAYAWLENNQILNNKIEKIKITILKKWKVFKNKVIFKLNEYKSQFIWNQKKQDRINYIISKIEKMKFLYWKTISNAPLLNTWSFINTFYWSWFWPILDEYKQIDPIESILFSWTTVIIEDFIMDWDNKIYKIKSNEYDYDWDFFIDARFVKTYNKKPSDRTINLPSKEEIINKLINLNWFPYVWWGNVSWWIPELAEYYKPINTLEDELKNKLILNWFDCSGLLYFVTNWYTPRNTSKLVYFWTWIEIEWLSYNEIIDKIEPLDLIVWKWHALIVLDKENLIESSINHDEDISWSSYSWVKIRKIKPFLEDLMLNRIWLNNYDSEVPEWKKKFVIRRWIK